MKPVERGRGGNVMVIGNPESTQIPQLRRLWDEAFSDTAFFIGAFFDTAFSTERCRCVTVEGNVAAALYWFSCSFGEKKLAYLYAVATAKEYRSRGICRLLMDDTHIHLKALGFDAAILVPGSDSLFGFYERMGYRICGSIQELQCTASDDVIAMQRIGRNEYEQLRRTFLPANGVLQEGENLDLLVCTEEFYRGEQFLLAGHCEDGKFVGVELLGEPGAAPQMLCGLGCGAGIFRMPGRGRAFVMTFPLHEKAELSDIYFGIAFDL